MFFEELGRHVLFFVIKLILHTYRVAAVRVDSIYLNVNMGLWAWFIYSYNYLIATFIAPFSLILWQNAYLLNILFVIQEIADTFGLLLVTLLFLLGQLFARNSMLNVFLSTRFTSERQTNSNERNSLVRYHWPIMIVFTSSYNHMNRLIQSISTRILQVLRQ